MSCVHAIYHETNQLKFNLFLRSEESFLFDFVIHFKNCIFSYNLNKYTNVFFVAFSKNNSIEVTLFKQISFHSLFNNRSSPCNAILLFDFWKNILYFIYKKYVHIQQLILKIMHLVCFLFILSFII